MESYCLPPSIEEINQSSHIKEYAINIYDLKNEKLAKDILTKIALQIGSEVSFRELANSFGANAVTVSNYQKSNCLYIVLLK